MKEIENVEPSGIDADRRQVLKYMGSSALALGVMSTIPFARANTMSNEILEGANNFYTSDLVAVQKFNFPNQYGMKIVGNLILPKNRDASKKLPAIVVGHPMGAVKEQSANLYATKMAEQGFAAMSNDLPFLGESEGGARNAVAPDLYSEAFSAAVDYLGTHEAVDRERIGGIGIVPHQLG